ncbi:hypothetical protein TNIN_199511 [Trichonephila inaurata madagascariensis]|uniref:Uncharacterized protein n=1 Tax=Trichonephila inaurata madagascariensis TaxID=2747483 RepID=A0A8X6WMU5_9ARAC|nr:hypothetical protein TNIN_199511 [Trichonephila inaurata madagascariensis]
MHRLYSIVAFLLCLSTLHGGYLPTEKVFSYVFSQLTKHKVSKPNILNVLCPKVSCYDITFKPCHDTSKCEEDILQKQNRSDVIIHSVFKGLLLQGALNVTETMESGAIEVLAEIVPSVRRPIKTKNHPVIISMKYDMLPFFNKIDLLKI